MNGINILMWLGGREGVWKMTSFEVIFPGLTHFKPMFPYSIPWKHKKSFGFLSENVMNGFYTLY